MTTALHRATVESIVAETLNVLRRDYDLGDLGDLDGLEQQDVQNIAAAIVNQQPNERGNEPDANGDLYEDEEL